MKNDLTFLFFLLLLFSATSHSQNIPADWHDFKLVIGDAITSPAHYDSRDFKNLGLTLVAVSGAYFIDNKVKDFSQKQRSLFMNDIFAKDKYFVEIAGSLTALTYLYGLASDNESTRKLGLKLAEAFIINGAITAAIKFIVGRERPSTSQSNNCFDAFSISWAKTSFPSGHTSTAFTLAAVLANETDQLGWKIFAYSIASAVGVSRMYNNDHWISDVVAGGLIGYFVGEFVSGHKTNNGETVFLSPTALSFTIPLN